MNEAAKKELRALWCRACAAAAREIAASSFDLTPDRLLARERGKAYVSLARQVAMYLTHVVCSVSLQDVGHLFRRDRTTASYACRRIEDLRDDRYFDAQLEQLEMRLKIRLEQLRVTQLRDQQAILMQEVKAVVGGEEERQLLLRTENGRLLEFKAFKG